MEKSRIRPVPAGKSVRMSYSRQKEVLEMPNLIEIQKDSYQWFLDEGLKEVFEDISPIADFAGHLSLEFVDFTLCKDDIKYTIEECKERDATYAAPLKVKVRLCNKDKDEINEHEIFMGDLPLMTDTGSFVINGAERVIVSQLVRSPGIYYGIDHDKIGKELYSCTVIPNRGAWLEYETDSNDVFYVRVDRTRKVPVTVLIRALGYGTNAEITALFGEEPKLLASIGKDLHVPLLGLYPYIGNSRVLDSRCLLHGHGLSSLGKDFAGCGIHHILCQDLTRDTVLKVKLLIKFISSDLCQIISSGVEEHAVQQTLGAVHGKRLAGTDLFI